MDALQKYIRRDAEKMAESAPPVAASSSASAAEEPSDQDLLAAAVHVDGSVDQLSIYPAGQTITGVTGGLPYSRIIGRAPSFWMSAAGISWVPSTLSAGPAKRSWQPGHGIS